MKSIGYKKDVLLQGIARVSGGLLSFVATFALTYLFCEHEIGEYNLILSTIQIITSIATLWISQSILRYYDGEKDLGSIIILSLFSVIFSCIIYCGYITASDVGFNIWACSYLVILVFYNIYDALFRKRRRFGEYVGLEVTFAVGRLFPMIIIAQVTNDYNSVFFSQFILTFLYFVVLIIKNKKTLKSTSYVFDYQKIKQYIRYGMPLVGLSISNWFLTTSDRYIIKFLGNNADVGIYSTNYNLGNSIYMMFSLIIVNAMHPIIVNAWDKDKNKAIRIASDSLNLYLSFMIPLVFYGCLKSEVLLSCFKGSSYADNSSIFVWTVWGIFLYGAALICHKYYECIQKTDQILFMNIAIACFNIITNVFAIKIWGFPAAAFTTFLSYALYICIVRVRTYKVFPITIDCKKLTKIIISVLIFLGIDLVIFQTENMFMFFIEGAVYVLYTMLFYQHFKVFDAKNNIGNITRWRKT